MSVRTDVFHGAYRANVLAALRAAGANGRYGPFGSATGYRLSISVQTSAKLSRLGMDRLAQADSSHNGILNLLPS